MGKALSDRYALRGCGGPGCELSCDLLHRNVTGGRQEVRRAERSGGPLILAKHSAARGRLTNVCFLARSLRGIVMEMSAMGGKETFHELPVTAELCDLCEPNG